MSSLVSSSQPAAQPTARLRGPPPWTCRTGCLTSRAWMRDRQRRLWWFQRSTQLQHPLAGSSSSYGRHNRSSSSSSHRRCRRRTSSSSIRCTNSSNHDSISQRNHTRLYSSSCCQPQQPALSARRATAAAGVTHWPVTSQCSACHSLPAAAVVCSSPMYCRHLRRTSRCSTSMLPWHLGCQMTFPGV